MAMPTLVKVGFSTKDPVLRAKEMNHTRTPHRYVVAYDVLVRGPRDIEQRVHEKLFDVREGKEWFKCSVPDAVAVIRELVRESALIEQVGDVAATRSSIESDQRDEVGTVQQRGAGAAASPRSSPQSSRIRTTATYSGVCAHCRESFSITLTRYDTVARCPTCFRAHDISEFQRSELMM
jgi:hypothetical protein